MTYRQLLSENADFRRLWAGQVVSEIGDWLNNVAVLALTIQLAGAGHEARAIALYAISRHLPLFLFGPIAGVTADRKDRRAVMIAADVLRAFLALGFLLASSTGSLSFIYIVGASLFAVSAFFNAAKRASIPNMVRSAEGLLAANSLSASTTAATIAVGSALGGLVSTFTGRYTVFIINAATFLISAEMIRRIRLSTREQSLRAQASRLQSERTLAHTTSHFLNTETAASSVRASRRSWQAGRLRSQAQAASILRRAVSDFREGLPYVRRVDVLSAIFVVAAGWGLGNGVARALYSVYGARLGEAQSPAWVARPTDFGISVLFVAMGAGGVLGAPLARRFNTAAGKALGSRMGRSMFFDGCGLVLFSLMPTLWSAALVLVAREINFAIWWTAQQTIMMSRTEDRFGGRVFASYETLTTLMMVGSMLVSGFAADRFGIRPVAATGGAVIALSGLLWFALRRRQQGKSESALQQSE
ncbi:MAG: MFS transporter, partial [Pyrinomonadaceae bacterium]